MEAGITRLDIYNDNYPYKKANGANSTLSVPFFEIPSGTLLFRGVQLPNPKKDEDPRLFVRDWLGYPRGDRFCMTPTHNTFFYTSPYVPFGAHTVGEWFNAIMVYQTVKDLRVVAMISPSDWTRGGKEIKSFDGTAPIQRCDKFDYSCLESKTSIEARKEKELKAWDNCIEPTFAKSRSVSGWMAIADYDSLDNFKEGLKGKDTTMGKYIMELESRLPGKGLDLLASTYTDKTNHRGFPEIVLFPWSPHPGTENQYTEARTEEDAADAIAEMSSMFNYLPIACITERGILEAFTGDFKAGDLPKYATSTVPGPMTRARIDKLQSDYLENLMTKGIAIEDIGTGKVKFDMRTGFLVNEMFTRFYIDPRTSTWAQYRNLLMDLSTQEDKDRVLEYKIKYRTFDKAKYGQGFLIDEKGMYMPLDVPSRRPKLLDGTPTSREFVFERPDELYKQFKELGLKLPSKMIPFVWAATEVYQKNLANKKTTTDPRGAEEARRKAEEARVKIQESLDFIAKKKAEGEAKKGKPTAPKTPETPKTPEAPKTPSAGPKTPEGPPLRFLTGTQTEIPIVRTMGEAIEIGLEALNQPDFQDFTIYPDGINHGYSGPWDMSEASLRNTLKYIFEKLHHSCYLLCVRNHVPYLFKLEGGGMHAGVRRILEEQIESKGITDLNLETSRVMQCIIKPYSAEASTATEWLGFLQSPLNQIYKMPNGAYILNLTDAVILRNDGTEPFDAFMDPLPKLEVEYRRNYYLPILSYSGKYKYDDIPIPNYDDIFTIKRTVGGSVDVNEVLGSTAPRYFYQKTINKAVFRGGTTGCGSTPETNMRLKLTNSAFLDSLRNKDMLDVGLTTITKQYKLDPESGLTKVDPATPTVAPLTLQEQCNYKYIIHIDGNVHAYRLLKTMLTGSCILRVKSPYRSWMDYPTNDRFQGFDILDMGGANDRDNSKNPLLSHWIWVASDLSNLDDVLDFCREHEDICIKIGQNAREIAETYLSMNHIYASFVNMLALGKDISLMEPTKGGGKKKEVKTRRQSKTKKRKTRKHHGFREKFVMAEYRGGGIDDGMASYIQNTMGNLWKAYLKKFQN